MSLIAAWVSTAGIPAAVAAPPVPAPTPADPRLGAAVFAIFQSRCVRCHGPLESSGGLRLDSYDALMRGGDRGPAVIAGDPRASLLLEKVLRRDEPAMPPRTRLPRRLTDAIRSWIAAGARPPP